MALTFKGTQDYPIKLFLEKRKYKVSKGWLFDIGAVFIQGTSLFETLLLNCILPFYDHGNLESIQCPCWEFY